MTLIQITVIKVCLIHYPLCCLVWHLYTTSERILVCCHIPRIISNANNHTLFPHLHNDTMILVCNMRERHKYCGVFAVSIVPRTGAYAVWSSHWFSLGSEHCRTLTVWSGGLSPESHWQHTPSTQRSIPMTWRDGAIFHLKGYKKSRPNLNQDVVSLVLEA